MAICEDCPEWEALIEDFGFIKERDSDVAEKGRFVVALILNEGKCEGPTFFCPDGLDKTMGYYICKNESLSTAHAVDNWAHDSVELDVLKMLELKEQQEE